MYTDDVQQGAPQQYYYGKQILQEEFTVAILHCRKEFYLTGKNTIPRVQRSSMTQQGSCVRLIGVRLLALPLTLCVVLDMFLFLNLS